jgi:hypothetical protein
LKRPQTKLPIPIPIPDKLANTFGKYNTNSKKYSLNDEYEPTITRSSSTEATLHGPIINHETLQTISGRHIDERNHPGTY